MSMHEHKSALPTLKLAAIAAVLLLSFRHREVIPVGAWAIAGLLLVSGLLVAQKHFIADALSGCNLLCGVFSMVFAAKEQVDVSLLFLMLGAAFDGLDGAAARRFGSTPWGVYSDDVADAVNYGIAPGFALYCVLRGPEGCLVGGLYTVLTLSRLIYFTMDKGQGDPNYFRGMPSTVGGLMALSAIVLFRGQPAILGLLVGIVCAQMVSFDTTYRHLGRALSSDRRFVYAAPALLVLFAVGRLCWIRELEELPVAVVLGACLLYGFAPMVSEARSVLARGAGWATDVELPDVPLTRGDD